MHSYLLLFGLLLGLLFNALFGFVSKANAHSWYPYSCCSDRDCAPVLRITYNPDGSMIMATTYYSQVVNVLIPKGYLLQPSKDAEAHVCVKSPTTAQRLGAYYEPLCVFLPGTS